MGLLNLLPFNGYLTVASGVGLMLIGVGSFLHGDCNLNSMLNAIAAGLAVLGVRRAIGNTTPAQ